MKRLISLLLTITLVFCITALVPLSVSAITNNKLTYTNEYGIWTYQLTDNGKGYKITDLDQSIFEYYIPKVEVPSTINNIPVLEIDDKAFYYSGYLTSVTIPNGVTSIGDSAFWNCSKLTNVTIPESVNYIGLHAFEKCIKLTSITIPDRVTSISDYLFYDCRSF